MTIGTTNPQPPLAPAYTLPETPTAPLAPALGNALGTNLGGIPGIPDNVEQYFGGKTSKDVAGQEGRVRQQQFGLLQQQTGLEQQIGENKQAQEQFLAQAKADIARQNRESAQKIEQSIQETRKNFPYPEFHPTQDNVQDLATLFSLVGVLGVAMGGNGKIATTGALNNMAGMMQGWQKGRQDVWVKEKETYDKNMARVKQVLDDAYKDADRAMKTLAYNREEAEAYANQAAAKMGGQVGKQILQKQGVEKFYNYMEGIKGDLQKTETMLQQKELHAQTEAAAERRHREQMKQQKELAEIKAQTARGGAGGVIQFRYNGAVATAADKLGIHLENLGSAASTSEVPRVGDVLTSERTVPTAMIKYFATTLTEPQNRALQQELAPTIREIANIESAGRPGGVTQASVNELGKMAPVGGDQKINYYMFLALAKQEAAIAKTTLEVSGGTKEQIDAAQKAIDKINKVVSWDVKDINRILTGPDGNTLVNDKMQNMLARSNGLDQFNTFVEQQKTNGGAETQSPIDPTTGYPTVNARGYVLHRDINGNFAYVSPDGKTVEEIQ